MLPQLEACERVYIPGGGVAVLGAGGVGWIGLAGLRYWIYARGVAFSSGRPNYTRFGLNKPIMAVDATGQRFKIYVKEAFPRILDRVHAITGQRVARELSLARSDERAEKRS